MKLTCFHHFTRTLPHLLVYKHSLIYWDEEKSRLWIEHDADGTLPIIE